MKNLISRRIISLLLALITMFSASVTLIGCFGGNDNSSERGSDNTAMDNVTSDGAPEDTDTNLTDDEWRDRIIFFEDKDYERDTALFDEMKYERPSFDAIIENTEAVISVIEKNEISFEEQIASIMSIEADYTNLVSMRALANIYVSRDASDEYWNAELSYINTKTPILLDLIEDMYVAAANSPYALRFESEYFGEGLIEKYKGGGIYSDTAISLIEREEELETAYTTLSTANVEITYSGETNTVDNIIDKYFAAYKNATNPTERAVRYVEFHVAEEKCMELYEAECNKILPELFVELIKVRKQIANELGLKSYAEYAYDSHDRDYSYEEASAFLDDISEYILPVYYMLSFTSLGKYLSSNAPEASKIKLDELINNSYYALNDVSEEYADIYRYMLQYGLYDVDLSKTNRNRGSYVTYIKGYDAPYLFMSASGTVSDYTTLLHEFGHFTDSFINNDSPTSIDQSEISSQALSYLMLTKMGDFLSTEDTAYLIETAMLDALMTLILQGFYAKVEELIYALPLERITKEELDAQVIAAAEQFSLNTNYFNDISSIFMTHTFVYPFYVQSYCTSLIPALEIFFMELGEEGSGFEAYRKIIDRNGESMTLEESLKDAGISSPFDEDIVKKTALKLYDYLIGGAYLSKREIAA